MSEKPRSTSPFDEARNNFDANKARHESQTWLDELQGEAGKTDFSEEARQRLEEIEAYRAHMEQFANDDRSTFDRNYDTSEPQEGETPGTSEHAWEEAHAENNARREEAEAAIAEAAAALDAKISSNVETRFMDMLAHQIADLHSQPVTEETTEKDVQTNERRIADLEAQLEDRMVRYEDSENFDPAVADELISRTDSGVVGSVPEETKSSDKPEETGRMPEANGDKTSKDGDKEKDDLDDETREALDAASDSSEESFADKDELDDATREALEAASGDGKEGEPETTEAPSIDELDDETRDALEAAGSDDELDDETREALDAAGSETEPKGSLLSRMYKRAGELAMRGIAAVSRHERKDGKKGSKKAVVIALGIVGVLAGAVAWRTGGFGLFSGGHVDPNNLPPSGGGSTPPVAPPSGGGSANPEIFSSAARTVTPGEGWLSELQQLNIPAEQRPAVLKKILASRDPKIMDWVYQMQDGNPGISHPGQIPADVLKSIENL